LTLITTRDRLLSGKIQADCANREAALKTRDRGLECLGEEARGDWIALE
jgi:hypothetical protein